MNRIAKRLKKMAGNEGVKFIKEFFNEYPDSKEAVLSQASKLFLEKKMNI
jgi:hypothetical protein